ncbi:hypothetical protein J5N97_006411 [Dioscorea zingiberensis]|uniref:E2 ubiquitin-conjugating enzyme n=1 Tax=Dioscorea zingiberensis TaxID=325984 RepID=A0A9D5D9W2_9LILI|nr:hypothetical protein J5N97_006411 [Dioscorea zingiberensis]
MLVNGKKVFVGSFLHRQVRDQINGPPKFKNVYIKNLAETVTVKKFNGSLFNEKVLYVGKAVKKAERRAQLKAKFEQERNNPLEKFKLANLYVKNLEDEIDDDRLIEIFRPLVMRDTQGYSKGFGFVAFLSPEDAQRVVHELNGKIIGKKPLFISVAQHKEERKAKLQARFAQLRALSARIPPTPLMHTIPCFFARRNGYPGFPYAQNARNGVGVNGTHATQMEAMNSPSTPPATLASVLAFASPDQHRSILGGELYPLVKAIEQEHAAKVTGMLLEMDQTEEENEGLARSSRLPSLGPQSLSGVRMSTPARKRLMRDFKRLQQDPPAGISGAPQENNIMLWNAVIFGPDDTPWDGGTFKLTLQFTEDYPNKPPTVRFVSRMFHPNIYADGSICLDILQNQWSPIYDVAAILTSIQSLLCDPNPNSPANSEAARMFSENKREYNRRVRDIVEQSWTAD